MSQSTQLLRACGDEYATTILRLGDAALQPYEKRGSEGGGEKKSPQGLHQRRRRGLAVL